MAFNGIIYAQQGVLTTALADQALRLAQDVNARKEAAGLAAKEEFFQLPDGVVAHVLDLQHVQEVRLFVPDSIQRAESVEEEDKEEEDRELTGITIQMLGLPTEEIDRIALCIERQSSQEFEPRVYSDEYLQRISSSLYRVNFFRPYYPEGIYAGNVDWRDEERRLQITWDGHPHRTKYQDRRADRSRNVYQGGEILATIPEGYGEVMGAALDLDGRLHVVAHNPSFNGNDPLYHLKLEDEWVLLHTFDQLRLNPGVNGNPLSFYPQTAFFFDAGATRGTCYFRASYLSRGAVVARVDLTAGLGFYHTYHGLKRGTVIFQAGVVGSISSGTVYSAKSETLRDELDSWAPPQNFVPCATDYDGHVEKTLSVSYGDYGWRAEGFSTYNNTVNDTGPNTWMPDQSAVRSRTTSGAGVAQLIFTWADDSGDCRYRMNGAPIAGLPVPLCASVGGRWEANAVGNSQSNASWSLTVTSDGGWDYSGGCSLSSSVSGTARLTSPDQRRLGGMFFMDLRDDVYGFTWFTSTPFLYGFNKDEFAQNSGTHSGSGYYNRFGSIDSPVGCGQCVPGTSTFQETRVFGASGAAFAGEAVESDLSESPDSTSGGRSFNSGINNVLPNPGSAPFRVTSDDFGGSEGTVCTELIYRMLRDGLVNISSFSIADPVSALFAGQTNVSSIQHVDGDRIYGWATNLAGGINTVKWNLKPIEPLLTVTPQQLSGDYDFRVF